MTSSAFSIRQATTADHTELGDLAQLDSKRFDARSAYAVAEMNGRIVAAVSTDTGETMADPFRPTAELVDLLRAHVGTAIVRQTRRHLSVRRAAMA